jgi:hypothetical protein
MAHLHSGCPFGVHNTLRLNRPVNSDTVNNYFKGSTYAKE